MVRQLEWNGPAIVEDRGRHVDRSSMVDEDTCGSAWLLIGRQLIGSMAQALDQGLGVTVIGNTRSRPWVRPKRGHGSSEKIQ